MLGVVSQGSALKPGRDRRPLHPGLLKQNGLQRSATFAGSGQSPEILPRKPPCGLLRAPPRTPAGTTGPLHPGLLK